MDTDPGAYGAAFADVYDAWYEDVTDVPSTVDTLVRLAGGGNLLELGVGTGRIAVPVAERLAGRARIVGVDASVASELPDEVPGEGYLNTLSPLQLEQYLAIANEALTSLLIPSPLGKRQSGRRNQSG